MAARYLLDLLKVFLYYLLLFALCRLIFLIYFASEVVPDGSSMFLRSLWRALPLDVSTASYLLFVPLLLLLVNSFARNRMVLLALKVFLVITSILIIAISISEIAVYREMHVKMNFNMLMHLAHPEELLLSVSLPLLILMFLLTALVGWACVMALNRIFPAAFVQAKIQAVDAAKVAFVFFITTGLLAIGCRGGLQPIPINEGEVYFSHNQCVNDATVNPLWNITHSAIENRKVLSGEGYKALPDVEAEQIVNELFAVNSDSTVSIFKTSRPNVCILILESWSADVIKSLGGYDSLAPNFEKLVSDGYLFTNVKPAGSVSDQGIPAILSGYPALPIGSAINQPERQVHLPCITNEFNPAGYSSSFFFGGQLIYGNIKSYIYRNGFGTVIEQKDLPASLPAGRLGINDSVMLSVWHDSIIQMKQPFLSCLFTLSTHSPFDMPSTESVGWGGNEMAYLNSIVYADRQLGKFFEQVKKEDWYNNTVFIVVADHSHNTPKNYEYCAQEFYHIPLLITGGALKDEFRGNQDKELASQTDIASTLLHQLKLNAANYRWSKNLMNPTTKRFGFYTFGEGFGYVEDGQCVIWNKKFPTLSMNNGATALQRDSLQKKGAAMLQILMKDFFSK